MSTRPVSTPKANLTQRSLTPGGSPGLTDIGTDLDVSPGASPGLTDIGTDLDVSPGGSPGLTDIEPTSCLRLGAQALLEFSPGCRPGSASRPTTYAATGYASKYPPVGPKSRANPSNGTVGVNTGNPAAPIAK